MRRMLLCGFLLALPVLLISCGDPPRADVGFRYIDAQGTAHDGNLECRRPKDSPTCARLIANPALLDPARRSETSSTQYFGPERLDIVGVVDGTRVEETFTRVDGAAEEAFQRAAGVLLPAIGMTSPR